MKQDKLCVEIISDGIVSSVKLNGIDYSMKTGKIIYEHDANFVPKLILEMYPDELQIRSSVGSAKKRKVAMTDTNIATEKN